MTRKTNKISTRLIRETREAFREFLDETNITLASNLAAGFLVGLVVA
jgi:hypothetical protein